MAGEDLDVIAPAPRAVDYRGERLEIQPLTIGAVPRLVREVRPLLDALLDSDVEALADNDDLGPLLALVADHGERVFTAAAIATGRPVAWIADGNPAEFITLARTVIEVNRDFFTQSVAPLLASLMASRSGDGPTSSITSPGAGTH